MAEAKLEMAINRLRADNSEKLDQVFGQGIQSNNILRDIKKSLEEQLEFARQGALDAEEARKKSGKKDDSKKVDKKESSSDDYDNPFDLKGIIQIVAGIGASALGFAVGLAQGFTKIFTGIMKQFAKILRLDKLIAPLTNLGKSINLGMVDLAKKVMKSVRAAILAFSISFPKITNAFLIGGEKLNAFGKFVSTGFTNIVKSFTSSWTNLKNAFLAGTNGVRGVARSANGTFRSLNTIEKFMNTWGKITGKLGTAIKTISSVFGDKIIKPFQSFISGIRGVGQSTSLLGKSLRVLFAGFRTIGRFIAFPVTIIMGIIDGFKGMMAGADRQVGTFDKIIGGAIGAITGVLKGLVAMPLDLIKSAISWIAEKIFGKDNFLTKFLDSFSFSDMFQMVGDRVADMFVKFFNGIIYNFANLGERLMKPFEDGFSFGAIVDLITSLPGTIIGGILDFGKNALSSLLSLFGAEDASKALDSFKFTDLIDNIIGRIGMFFSDMFGSLFSDLTNIFEGDGPMLDRILQFVKNLVTSLYTWPLDLLKNMASGILDFFGMDDASQALDNFSFKDTFGKIIDWVIALPGRLVDGLMGILSGDIDVGQMISDAMSGAMEMANQFNEYLKGIAQPYLSALTQDDSWLGKLGNFLVPKAAFEWAGVDPDTGAVAAPKVSAPDVTAQTDRGSQVSEMSRENASARSGTNVAVVNAPVQQTTQNVNNSNTAAIIDQNLPTVDYNDRSFAFA